MCLLRGSRRTPVCAALSAIPSVGARPNHYLTACLYRHRPLRSRHCHRASNRICRDIYLATFSQSSVRCSAFAQWLVVRGDRTGQLHGVNVSPATGVQLQALHRYYVELLPSLIVSHWSHMAAISPLKLRNSAQQDLHLSTEDSRRTIIWPLPPSILYGAMVDQVLLTAIALSRRALEWPAS